MARAGQRQLPAAAGSVTGRAGGAPDLVRLEAAQPAGVPGVVVPVGHVRRRAEAPPGRAGASGAVRRAAADQGAVPDANMTRAAADALGVDLVNLRRRRDGGQS